MTPLAVASWLLRLLTAGGLAADAYVHADLAGTYDAVHKSISQGTLFRIEAAAAALAALLVLLLYRWVGAALFAFLVAALGLGAVLLYRYVDVGAIGPLPNMYEPVWYAEKTAATIAMAVALAAAAALLALPRGRRPAVHPLTTAA